MKKKINGMIVEPKAPNEMKVGDIVYYNRHVPGGDCFKIYALTKHVIFVDGEEWFYARRVHPCGVCLNEDDESILIGAFREYKILNI